jgi:hypothetical protein
MPCAYPDRQISALLKINGMSRRQAGGQPLHKQLTTKNEQQTTKFH